MTFDKAKKLKPGTLIVQNLKTKNRIWAVAIGTLHINEESYGYFRQVAPYIDIPLPIYSWRDYRVMTKKEREQYLLWKLENA